MVGGSLSIGGGTPLGRISESTSSVDGVRDATSTSLLGKVNVPPLQQEQGDGSEDGTHLAGTWAGPLLPFDGTGDRWHRSLPKSEQAPTQLDPAPRKASMKTWSVVSSNTPTRLASNRPSSLSKYRMGVASMW